MYKMKLDMKFNPKYFLLIFLLFPQVLCAWWNGDWESRKQITLDTSITGADLKESLSDFPVLVRLHAGNFSYFSEMASGGDDIRIMADDKTPLKFQVEKFDAMGEMALVWVRVPSVQPAATSDGFSIYYGNDNAPKPDGGSAVYSDTFSLVYHFDDKSPLAQDSTAYGNNGEAANVEPDHAGWIGASAKLSGSASIRINASPSLTIDPVKGWTFTAWIKPEQLVAESYVMRAEDSNSAISLLIRDGRLIARYESGGSMAETMPTSMVEVGKWVHVGVVLKAEKAEIFINGSNTTELPLKLVPMSPAITLGGMGSGGFFTGSIDEVQISSIARPVDWIKLSHNSQSPDFTVLNLGQDEGKDSGGGTSSFVVIIQNVTIDGWIVIGLTIVMFIVAVVVMVMKTMVIRQVRKDNKAFLLAYENLNGADDLDSLDREETREEKELQESDFLSAVLGAHDHYQSSPLYHLYHVGIREMKKRVQGKNARPLSNEALNVIRVTLDAIVVRESQRLNSKMVLLTIAIAGGPFLGLLGTVVGVMITFAVIAASGDVNINSIAPGIAAALLATVAGLAVAIPALFAYNYLLVQIKDIVAELRVFSDEFLAMLAEKSADHFREA